MSDPTNAERQRRYIARLKAKAAAQGGVSNAAIETELAKLRAENAALKAELAKRRGEGHLTRSHREERGRPVEFTEVGRLRAEIGRLKSDIHKLKAALQEEPDAAKLRKKVIDQQAEMASMRQVMKKIAKERDQYKVRVKPNYREARRLLTRQNYGVIIKALHPDRARHVTAAELAEAGRLAAGLRPLFAET
jgi:hypothetical protein